ncbi:MAG TPA: YggT family protein [Gemmatimonadales bacterium]|nr:YggT family protein [Gemmatimonadales bacterium]
MSVFAWLDLALRWLVVAALVYGVVVALTHWAVRARRLTPFGAWPRFVRRISDPVLRPVEQRVIRFGGSPQDAPLWLLGLIVVLGLLLITFVRWVAGWWLRMQYLAQAGPGAWLVAGVGALFNLVELAIFVRVIVSWFGVSPYRSWMRPVMFLTNWIIEPLRRVLPPLGPFDMSPVVAYLLLAWLIEPVVLRVLAGAL